VSHFFQMIRYSACAYLHHEADIGWNMKASRTGHSSIQSIHEIIRAKNFNSLQSYVRRYESKLENGKNIFGAILSSVEFQTGSYKTSQLKYLKNITVYPKQNFVVDTFA